MISYALDVGNKWAAKFISVSSGLAKNVASYDLWLILLPGFDIFLESGRTRLSRADRRLANLNPTPVHPPTYGRLDQRLACRPVTVTC